MNIPVLTLLCLSGVCILTAIVDAVYMAIQSQRTVKTTGTIIDTYTTIPDNGHPNNSRRAYMQYFVAGELTQSENPVFVSMSAREGNEVPIWYYKDNPHRIYGRQKTRPFFIAVVGVVLLSIALINLR